MDESGHVSCSGGVGGGARGGAVGGGRVCEYVSAKFSP